MKRILTYTAAGLLVAMAGFGVSSNAQLAPAPPSHGDYESQPARIQNNGIDANAIKKDFRSQMQDSIAQQDENELQRRQYIPQYMEGSSGTIEGTVTLVGDHTMKMVEAGTRLEHRISVTEAQQKALTTGYNIRADVQDGKLVSFTELGVPPDVEKIVYSAEDLPTDNILEQQKAF
ncbi:MAG: hypothetical protein ACHQ6U_09260 [Thermodesulfobacteriota bacterium]